MEGSITDLKETGHWNMPATHSEFFLNIYNSLRFSVLQQSATREFSFFL